MTPQERRRAYYAKHRATIRARDNASRATHRDRVRAQDKIYRATKPEARRRYDAAHREDIRAYQKAYGAAHRDQLRAYGKAYADTHREEIAAYRKVYAARRLERFRAWVHANPGRWNALTAKRRSAMLQATPAWANPAAIRAIYADAARLTCETGIQHQVDHYYPLRSPVVCGLHVEHNLRIITKTENCRKKNRHPKDLAA